MCFSAIAIYNLPDVHPILKAYEGKDVPLEYAKTEAISKAKHLAEWNAEHRPSVAAPSFRNLFGLVSTVSDLAFSVRNFTFKHHFFRLPQEKSLHQRILSGNDKKPKETIGWIELTWNVKETNWRDFWRKIKKLWLWIGSTGYADSLWSRMFGISDSAEGVMFVLPFARYIYARFMTEQFLRWIGIYKHYWCS
jgi:hypothetical protein